MRPFTEYALFEQDARSSYDSLGNLLRNEDPFFMTGSSPSLGEEVGSFTGPLEHKEQLRFSFDVNQKTQMLEKSSSIYYFDVQQGQWKIPQRTYENGIIAGPFDKISFKTLYSAVDAGLTTGTSGSFITEDRIGFDSYGNSVGSGSLNMVRNIKTSYAQSFEEVGTLFDRARQVDILTKDLNKSFSRSVSFNAEQSQRFSVQVDAPFLITKAVIEMPMCFGNGWFYDKTTTLFASASLYTKDGGSALNAPSYFIEEGGPGLTVSLLCERFYGKWEIRDLIAKSLITHQYDATTASIEFTNIFSGSSDVQTRFSGTYVSAFINGIQRIVDDACVVVPIEDGSNRYFTGSIVAKTEANVTNGVKLIYASTPQMFHNNSSQISVLNDFDNFLQSPYVNANGSLIAGVDPFGRGMTGFAPSGGSIFGGEYVTSQGVMTEDGRVRNPFYTPDAAYRATVLAAASSSIASASWDSYSKQYFGVLTQLDMNSRKPSPYLVNPGDRLILAVSKTHPAHHRYSLNVNTADISTGRGEVQSSSYYNPVGPGGHDVTFNTGTINITLYGSYVRENKEYIP